jgi:hypothetical protein
VLPLITSAHADKLRRLGSAYGMKYITVITGVGRHSVGGQAKIKPAVEKFLAEEGYSFRALHAGCVRVNLKRT